ncbi:MAG: anthranilate synthase component I, partial [Proteobacteria bacterium]|nr:anthranilate synthase component I [Pseudomonadota bacterium]
MSFEPSFERFASAYERGESQCLITRLVADLETPVSASMKLRAAFPGPSILLESVEGGAVRGRYSIIGLAPDVLWRCIDGIPSVALNGGAFVEQDEAPLDSLRSLLKISALPLDETLPPMACG